MIPNKMPLWKFENGLSGWVVPSAGTGQESQQIYEITTAAWLKQIVMSSVRSRDGERSIQLPTAEENNSPETVDVMPLKHRQHVTFLNGSGLTLLMSL